MSAPVQTLSDKAVVHAYRHLYRQGLRASQYSTPSRHILRSILRKSFRSSSPEDFDASKIANTLKFLDRAASAKGFEHRILKNLLFVRYWEMSRVLKEARL